MFLRRLGRTGCVLVSVALVLTGCADTRVTLGTSPALAPEDLVVGTVPEGAKVFAPRASVDSLRFEDDPGSGETEGYVRVRYSVTAAGEVRDVSVVEASARELELPALRILAAWPHSVGTVNGTPANFRNLEADITFFQEPGVIDTPKENVLVGLGIAGVLGTFIIISIFTGANAVN